MTYKLITSSIADKDVEKAIKYYIKIRKELAQQFLSETRTTKKFILENPNKIQIRYDKIRIALFKKLPYGIHFKFENDTITIVGVFHTSQNPDEWKER